MSALIGLARQIRSGGSNRLLLVIAGGALVLSLQFLASSPASKSNNEWITYVDTSSGPGCSSPSLLSLRNEASFWTASRSASSLRIQPKEDAIYYNCPELSLAAFSLRLHDPNGQSHLVVAPLSQPSSAGSYSLPLGALPAPIRTHEVADKAQAEVEVILEFGFYPGARSGQPCAGATCQPAELSRMGVEWSGREVVSEDGKRLIMEAHGRKTEDPSRKNDLEPCPILSPLPVVLSLPSPSTAPQTSPFTFLDPTGSPCSLFSPHPLPPSSSSRPITWIHLLGDSNLRHLIPHLARPMGLQHCTSHTRKPEPYPTEWVCHDGSVGGVVLTFAWWFLTTDQNDALNLGRIDLGSLSAFLSSIPFPSSFPSSFHSSTTPTSLTHLFISLGSHAPLYTTLGLTSALTKLLPAFSTQINRARTTSFLTTTAVNPRAIPKNYGPQAVMRNNVMLRRTNEVLQRFVEGELSEVVAQGRGGNIDFGGGVEEEEEEDERSVVEMLDVFSLSAVVPTSMMVDSVHFKEDAGGEGVYDAWARIMWTAVERRLGSEKLGGEDDSEGRVGRW